MLLNLRQRLNDTVLWNIFVSRAICCGSTRCSPLQECCHHTGGNLCTGHRVPVLSDKEIKEWPSLRKNLRRPPSDASNPTSRPSKLGGARLGEKSSWRDMGVRHAGITCTLYVFGETLDISPQPVSTPHAALDDSLYSVPSGVCVADRCVGAMRERVCCGDVTGGVWVRSVLCTCCFRRRSCALKSAPDVPYHLNNLREVVSSSCHAFC